MDSLSISSILLENTGNYVIQKEYLSQFNPGLYTLQIKRYEPIFIKQPQNKQILVLCTTSHKINVIIKD